jgi:hypothetical protein
MKHNLPILPIFHDNSPGGPVEEVALRVFVELPDWEIHILGTATLIGSSLAVTAKHVIEASMRWFKVAKNSVGGKELEGASLRLLQILPGPVYRLWNVSNAWITSSDIAILHLNLDRTPEADPTVEWRCLPLRVTPPPTGQKVVAFGYRESQIQVTKGPNGQAHIDFNDKPTTSAGVVGRIFPERRDSSMLNFPCFEVHAQFAPGMSGGLVLDEDGWLCGLVCSAVKFDDPNTLPLSYAATLWPILTTEISADRGNSYPRGIRYPVIDLALDKIIQVSHLEDLDPVHFPGRTLPRY